MIRKHQPKKIIIVLLLAFLSLNGQAQDSQIILSFENAFGEEPMQLKKEFENTHGEKVSFSLFNYFISNIQFTRKDGSKYVVPQDSSYFLIKESDPNSQDITLAVPKGKYKSLSFTIGIDSLRSTQGPDKRQGVLDVGADARGMYWAWNSGYIFLKMEGKSPASPDSLRNNFYYHIGGYGGFDQKTLNNIRTKSFEFRKPLTATPKAITVATIRVNTKQFFEGPIPLKVGEHPSVMWGPVSTQIADAYVRIFSLIGVSYQDNRGD